MQDRLLLQIGDLDVNVLTGIYSEETHLPQPLRISIAAELTCRDEYDADTPLSESKNYMELKDAATKLPEGVHFSLIEGVADHIIRTLFDNDDRVLWVQVKIVKLAISENGEQIGITLERARK